MSLLTDQEIHAADPAPHERFDQERIDFARAIEQAVIRKLATVGVEPCAWEVETEQQDGTRAKWVSTDRKRHREFCDFGEPRQLYSQEAIAAARVQALEDAANRLRDLVLEHPRNAAETALQCEAAIRALIGGLNV